MPKKNLAYICYENRQNEVLKLARNLSEQNLRVKLLHSVESLIFESEHEIPDYIFTFSSILNQSNLEKLSSLKKLSSKIILVCQGAIDHLKRLEYFDVMVIENEIYKKEFFPLIQDLINKKTEHNLPTLNIEMDCYMDAQIKQLGEMSCVLNTPCFIKEDSKFEIVSPVFQKNKITFGASICKKTRATLSSKIEKTFYNDIFFKGLSDHSARRIRSLKQSWRNLA